MGRPTAIEIARGNTRNLGAELMVRETHRRVTAAEPGALVGLWPHTHDDRFITELRARRMVGSYGRGGWRRAARLTPLRLRSSRLYRDELGLLAPTDLDAVLDVSGFALSDQWGADKAGRIRDYVRDATRRGARYLLLPQAYGPFTDPQVRAATEEIGRRCTAMYARDAVSEHHLRDLDIDPATIRRAPDITIGAPATPDPDVPDRAVAVVPNARLTDRAHDPVGAGRLVDLFVEVSRRLEADGAHVLIAPHTSERGDLELATQILERAGLGASRLRPPTSAPAMKSLLAACEVVLAARFHAVVGAMSSGVPAVALAWSHKYAELVGDLGVDPELACLDAREALDLGAAGLTERLREVTATPRDVLRVAVEERRRQLDAMWDDVLDEALGLRARR